MNRHEKGGKDAAEWVPDRNRCWFAGRVLDVRRAYGLTVDRREAEAHERILSSCEGTALEPFVCAVPSSSAAGAPRPPLRMGTMRSRSTTTMGAARSPARRRGRTGLPRFGGRTRRTRS